MKTTRTTRIVSILVFLILLVQGNIYGYKYKTHRGREGTHTSQNRHQHTPLDIDISDKPKQTQSGACGGRQERSSAISNLDEFVLEEEDYPVVDYVLVIHAAKSTTSRYVIPNIVLSVIQMNKEKHRLRPIGVGSLPPCKGAQTCIKIIVSIFFISISHIP